MRNYCYLLCGGEVIMKKILALLLVCTMLAGSTLCAAVSEGSKSPSAKDLQEKIKELQDQITAMSDSMTKQADMIAEQSSKISEQNAKISEQNDKINEQGSKIEAQNDTIIEQNNKISEQNDKISEQNDKINEQSSKINEQSSKINEQAGTISKHSGRRTLPIVSAACPSKGMSNPRFSLIVCIKLLINYFCFLLFSRFRDHEVTSFRDFGITRGFFSARFKSGRKVTKKK